MDYATRDAEKVTMEKDLFVGVPPDLWIKKLKTVVLENHLLALVEKKILLDCVMVLFQMAIHDRLLDSCRKIARQEPQTWVLAAFVNPTLVEAV
jgi:hypothetical protein